MTRTGTCSVTLRALPVAEVVSVGATAGLTSIEWGADIQAADCTANAGVELAFEFHGGTLTDNPHPIVRLLEEIDRPTVRTYWQPPVGVEDSLAGLVGASAS
jgi:hypothetical protein